MTITPLSGSGNTQQQQGIRNAEAKLQAALAALATAQEREDIAALSIAAQLQSETAGLKQASNNLAQAASLTQVADGGAEQVQKALVQLQTLAIQAQSPTITDETREQLNIQFQALVQQIDKTAETTSFADQPLLDGSKTLSLDNLLTGDSGETATVDVAIKDLSTKSLFSELPEVGSIFEEISEEDSIFSEKPDISSMFGAAKAVEQVSEALNQVAATRADLGAFQQTLEFASANVDTAIANQEAARAEIQDTDFTTASTRSSLAEVQRNASIALAAQTNRLSPALLKLVG